jgi:Domain of unknown function (DUF4352)
MAIPLHVKIATPLALLVLAGAGVACDSGSGGTAAVGGNSSASGSGVVTGSMGVPIKAGDGKSVTVQSVQRNYTAPGQLVSTGKECVVVNVLFTNGSSSEWMLPETEMGVVDGNGAKYDTSSGIGCGGPSSNASNLVAGGHEVDPLTFQVPAGSPLNFTWQPNMFESTTYQVALH